MTERDEGLKRFAALVAAYGARPQAWPEAERAGAQALMRTSPAARRLAEEAAEVDRWLDGLGAPAPSAGLEARILARAPVRPRAVAQIAAQERAPVLAGLLQSLRERLGAPLLRAPVMRPLYATACAALIGLLLGSGGVFSQPAGEEEEILALAFLGGNLEQYDLGE